MKKTDSLRQKVKSLQKFYSLSNEQMAVKMMTSERSYNRKLANIENMKVGELLRLESILHTNLLNTEEGVVC